MLQPLVLAQFATLAGWLALGDGGMLARSMCVAVAVALSEMVVQVDAASQGFSQNLAEGAAVAAAFISALSLPLFVAAAFGWRCQRNDDEPPVKRPFQFRIAHVMVFTGVVGVLLGLWKVLPERLTGMAVISAAVALFISPCSAAQWFLQLGPRLGLMWFVALSVAAGYSVTAIVLFYHHEPLSIAATVLYAAVLGVNVALFRGWGYRLVRKLDQQSPRPTRP